MRAQPKQSGSTSTLSHPGLARLPRVLLAGSRLHHPGPRPRRQLAVGTQRWRANAPTNLAPGSRSSTTEQRQGARARL
eukprot:4114059-Lingulodinium_polyedra.AAC.1